MTGSSEPEPLECGSIGVSDTVAVKQGGEVSLAPLTRASAIPKGRLPRSIFISSLAPFCWAQSRLEAALLRAGTIGEHLLQRLQSGTQAGVAIELRRGVQLMPPIRGTASATHKRRFS